jgi:pSer/pThr/pTyr-binding forkhead associated (FHA) protein
MAAMTDPHDDAGSSDLPDHVAVEHDPTIVYRPADESRSGGDAGPSIAGAFRYALVVERGPRAGLTYVLGEGETLAGRSDDVAIFLGDVTVSRHHARFLVDESGLSVQDLRSTNGTYVNLERRDDRAALAPGDEIMIGKFHLAVVVGSE